ncbi:type ISP restriction/modification enzyme [Dehalogenimonas sp. 4OHTPN]|uniref:site-specific DNA-methyltransferase (adenine-specific) n=1 Tax=Dehalogenimonas sp. 4OHTPN TaxID=3166643 RepID=A0AAU8GBJ7_9CHLR
MTEATALFKTYLAELAAKLATGDSTEHSHRTALQHLIEGLLPSITAVNDPKHTAVGAPDFLVKKGEVIIGHIEAKDIGVNLEKVEKTDQFKRYVPALSNFILTDYLEFRHYIDGKLHYQKSLGSLVDGKIKRQPENIPAVAELLDRFLSMNAASVGTPKELAVRMAKIAHYIRNLILETLNAEAEKGELHNQLAAFRENLIPELSHEQFADMYAQTIAYGLFAARCTKPTEKHFTRSDAAQNLPKTNPFLRKLFQHIAGYDLDPRIAWLVDELAQVLAQADMAAVLKDFGKHSGKEDPVVHFYETFLKEYDPKMREMRGVYYTPEPVVSYIVRSVDHLLKTRFNKPTGLADDSVYILDPAVGTATFLYMVINEIHEAVVGAGQKGAWNDYVAKKLLPRLYGFELLMAPYAVAHLKLGLQLQETGYKFETDERLGIYLTNTLEEAAKHAAQMGFSQWISEESNAAAEVKKDKPIMVVLGNPPYSKHSVNKGPWIKKLIETYKTVDGKPLGEKNPKWLQDDYVKFIRFGQWRINRTGQGIMAFVTNHGYLDNPTFRGMRRSLMDGFSDIYIYNLHGNSNKREIPPDGGRDENVFDIQQGVAIAIFIKEAGKTTPAKIHYGDLWGIREQKNQLLGATDITQVSWGEPQPISPFYMFPPANSDLLSEFSSGWNISEIFRVNSVGILTSRDELTIRWSKEEVSSTIKEFCQLSVEDARLKYNLGEDVRDWKVNLAQKDLKDSNLSSKNIIPVLYRPFDTRYTYFTGHSRGFHCMPRGEVMHHMLLKDNLALISARMNKTQEMNHFLCARNITEIKCGEYTIGSYLFPLYLYPVKGEMQFEVGRRPNLNPEFIKDISNKLELAFIPDGKGDLETTFGPEDIFNYAYAVFHSPTYRSRYAEFLKIDFPRLQLTSDKELFKALAEKGEELVALHLMEAAVLNHLITSYPLTGSQKVEKVSYDEKLRRVYINKEQFFEGVEPEVWEFQVGGYQVAEKWLKDRKGRTLTYDDIIHYQRIIVALTETRRVMAEIDEIIPGWPVE